MPVEVHFKSTGMDAKSLLSISDVSHQTGLSSATLRFYEREGLVVAAARVSGRRHFDESVLTKLAVIGLLQDVGFTINEISGIIGRRSSKSWRSMAEAKLDELDARIERIGKAKELLSAALKCNCSTLDSCGVVHKRANRHRKAVGELSRRLS